MSPPLPHCEPERLRALDRYAILDTPSEPAIDHFTVLAADLFEVPIALLTLVDAERQWFKSVFGLGEIRETPRDVAFCAFTILGHQPLIVPDAALDERFRDNPLVTGPPYIRFYAGAPLTTSDGFNLGDLCIADVVPRVFGARESTSLVRLASLAAAAIEGRFTEDRLRREIAVHEQTAKNLREVEGRYQRIVAHSPGMVHQFVRYADGRGKFLFVSDACRDILELEPSALEQSAGDFPKLIHRDDLPSYQRAAAGSMETLATLRWEGRYLAPSGALKWVQLLSQPTRMGDGSILWDGVLLDVTARKLGEEALIQAKQRAEQAQAEAEKANAAKSEFLSRVSHELRTPLNAILGFGQLLALNPLSEQDAQGVGHILDGGRHLLALVDEMLELARIEAGEIALELKAVSFGKLAAQCVSFVDRMAQARRIVCAVDESAAAATPVWADEHRLRQVLLNLLANAIKYNREGGRVSLGCEARPGNVVRWNVRDTGHGVAPEGMVRLFVPFERLGRESGEIKGTGLGLVVSRQLVEAMGGKLGVASELNVGSTFWIDLPAAPLPTPGHPGSDGSAPVASRVPADHSPMTLLYIEDNPSNLEVVEMIVARLRPRWRVIAARDGPSGLRLAGEQGPDLILLDLQLPGMQGDTVLAALRSNPHTAHVPVLLLSADATVQSRERLLALGANDYLPKPFSVEELLEKIDRLTRGGR